jgi:hypothetical protein
MKPIEPDAKTMQSEPHKHGSEKANDKFKTIHHLAITIRQT